MRYFLRLGVLGALITLITLAVSACGGGSGGGGNHRPEEASKPKPELTTAAGGGEHLGDGGPAKSAGLCGPTDVALDAAGNIYISDTGLYCSGPGGVTIRKVDPQGVITTVAGTGEEGHSGDGGPATTARLTDPGGIAFDDRGNLYLADYTSVRKIDPSS